MAVYRGNQLLQESDQSKYVSRSANLIFLNLINTFSHCVAKDRIFFVQFCFSLPVTLLLSDNLTSEIMIIKRCFSSNFSILHPIRKKRCTPPPPSPHSANHMLDPLSLANSLNDWISSNIFYGFNLYLKVFCILGDPVFCGMFVSGQSFH